MPSLANICPTLEDPLSDVQNLWLSSAHGQQIVHGLHDEVPVQKSTSEHLPSGPQGLCGLSALRQQVYLRLRRSEAIWKFHFAEILTSPPVQNVLGARVDQRGSHVWVLSPAPLPVQRHGQLEDLSPHLLVEEHVFKSVQVSAVLRAELEMVSLVFHLRNFFD
jgi:hypothetical protein